MNTTVDVDTSAGVVVPFEDLEVEDWFYDNDNFLCIKVDNGSYISVLNDENQTCSGWYTISDGDFDESVVCRKVDHVALTITV